MAVLTAAISGQEGGGAVAMRESVREENRGILEVAMERERRASVSVSVSVNVNVSQEEGSRDAEGQTQQPQQQQQQQPQTYMVTVPPGIGPGMQFRVEVEGQHMSKLHSFMSFTLIFICMEQRWEFWFCWRLRLID